MFATISTEGSGNWQWLVLLIPLVVPVLISKLRAWIEKTFGKAALPYAAIILGALCDVALQTTMTGQIQGGEAGIFLGAAAIGVREICDQTRKAIKDWWENRWDERE